MSRVSCAQSGGSSIPGREVSETVTKTLFRKYKEGF